MNSYHYIINKPKTIIMKKTVLKVLGVSALSLVACSAMAQVYDTGSNVGIGVVSPGFKLDVDGGLNLSTGISIGGNQVFSTAGLKNMFIGDGTGANLTTGSYNAAIGFKAGELVDAGQFNTIIGFKAGQNMTGANSNTIIGKEAGKNNLGNQNVLIGREAGISAEGSENTVIGDKAGTAITTGSSNTLIGKNADVTIGTLTNATAIGAGATVGASNSVVLGNNARVGIGTTEPLSDLHVAGAGYFEDSVITGKLIPLYIEDWTQSTGSAGQVLSIDVGGELLWATGGGGATGPTGPSGTDGADGSNGTNGSDGAGGPAGPQGPTGPLVSGSSDQTLRHDGSSWVASSLLDNDGSVIRIGSAGAASS
ncbi:MAG: hypothetical protein ACI85F_002803, partial [Bacteroidia bacterium]